MISTQGKAVTIDAPKFYESSGINKINGKYYFSYSSNFSGNLAVDHFEGYPLHGEIAYMVSNSPMGPFEYIGVIMKNPAEYFGYGGNSHQSIFYFRDEWFISYHAQTVAEALGRPMGYRSPHINRLELYGNGYIKPVAANREGVTLSGTVDPYIVNTANTFAWCAGIRTAEDNQGHHLTHIHNGDWIAIANVDFGSKGASRFVAFVSSDIGGEIVIKLDNLHGEELGSLGVGTTSDNSPWEERSCEVKAVPGVHHIFLLFKGDSENLLFRLESWTFEPFV
jgi:arabinoxylan arabinofuranohydrolase